MTEVIAAMLFGLRLLAWKRLFRAAFLESLVLSALFSPLIWPTTHSGAGLLPALPSFLDHLARS